MKRIKTKPRSKWAVVIIANKIQVLPFIREETWPAQSDMETEPWIWAVVRWNKMEMYFPIEQVIFVN